jgi:hypothetical protein
VEYTECEGPKPRIAEKNDIKKEGYNNKLKRIIKLNYTDRNNVQINKINKIQIELIKIYYCTKKSPKQTNK